MIAIRILRKGQEILRRIRQKMAIAGDPLLALCGSGRAIWADEHADEYVDNLRKGWN